MLMQGSKVGCHIPVPRRTSKDAPLLSLARWLKEARASRDGRNNGPETHPHPTAIAQNKPTHLVAISTGAWKASKVAIIKSDLDVSSFLNFLWSPHPTSLFFNLRVEMWLNPKGGVAQTKE